MSSLTSNTPSPIDFTIDTGDESLNDIIKTGIEQSPLVQLGLSQSSIYNDYIHQEQKALFELAQHQFSYYPDQTIKVLQAKVLDRISQDLTYVEQLNCELKPYSATDEAAQVTWALKTNKMVEILEGAQAMVADTDCFLSFIQQDFASCFDAQVHYPVLLGEPQQLAGTSTATMLSAALIETNLVLLGENTTISDLPLFIATDSGEYINWIDNSAIIHINAIPEQISISEDAPGVFSFYFSDNQTPQGLVTIHSGYAFGGQRGETRYEDAKEWGPEDCSSWVAKITQCTLDFSTLDQLYTFRLEDNGSAYIDPTWLDSGRAEQMQASFVPVQVVDPFVDIKAGQIFAYRDFITPDHDNSIGVSGHTGMVVGVAPDGQVLVLCYSRDMPDIEGFGIQTYDWHSTDTREVMFFDVATEALELVDVLDHRVDVLIESLGCPVPTDTTFDNSNSETSGSHYNECVGFEPGLMSAGLMSADHHDNIYVF